MLSMNVPSRTRGNPAVGSKLVYGIIGDANLIDANPSQADLSDANLTEACYDISTTWPEGFDPKAKGAVLVED